jgi:hypothetical protein
VELHCFLHLHLQRFKVYTPNVSCLIVRAR